MLLVKDGFLVDPTSGRNGVFDILIEDGHVAAVDTCMEVKDSYEVIDAKGKYIMPGFVDLHEHFREPGYTYKETVKTGSMAAARGGFTSVFCMPNTKPVTDSRENYDALMDIIAACACINVFPVGAITKGQLGEELAEIEKMAEGGMKAVSEDGRSVMNSFLCREGMKLAKKHDIPVFAHCEDIDLVCGGVMNEGKRAKELKLKGITNAVEDIIAARDILLAKETGVRLHLCHVSTRDSVRMISLAKEDGINVTGEVCPHHFTLCDEDIPSDDSNYKMNPPLRSRADKEALIEGIKSGVIDVIATDHAPHSAEEKIGSMSDSPFGIVGSETAFALSYTELVEEGHLTLDELVKCMSVNPAKIAGIDRGNLGVGAVADFVIADIDTWYEIDPDTFSSKGRNTPFAGYRVKGRIEQTFVGGQRVFMEV